MVGRTDTRYAHNDSNNYYNFAAIALATSFISNSITTLILSLRAREHDIFAWTQLLADLTSKPLGLIANFIWFFNDILTHWQQHDLYKNNIGTLASHDVKVENNSNQARVDKQSSQANNHYSYFNDPALRKRNKPKSPDEEPAKSPNDDPTDEPDSDQEKNLYNLLFGEPDMANFMNFIYSRSPHALHNAIIDNKIEQLADLLTYTKQLDCINSYYSANAKYTPLHLCISHKNYRAMLLCLAVRADVNKSTGFDQFETPLHLAIRFKNSSFVRLLVLSGADPSLTNLKHQNCYTAAKCVPAMQTTLKLAVNDKKIIEQEKKLIEQAKQQTDLPKLISHCQALANIWQRLAQSEIQTDIKAFYQSQANQYIANSITAQAIIKNRRYLI